MSFPPSEAMLKLQTARSRVSSSCWQTPAGQIVLQQVLLLQVAGVESITNGEFLLLTGQAVLDAMSDFQESQRKRLSSALSEDVLCAAVNNNNRAYTASIEFQEHMEEVLQPQLQVCGTKAAVRDGTSLRIQLFSSRQAPALASTFHLLASSCTQ